ncbi:MAG: toxin secretion protein [Planctomyces sp.]|nr:toxin secretion protein [Planctomyces sp.]
MLSRVAYDEHAMPSLQLARSSRLVRRTGRWLFAALVLGFIFVSVSPWQQSVRGTGDVIAFAPAERQQTLEAPIKGRIISLGEGIFENAFVKKGDMIAVISDIDSDYLSRLESSLNASQQQVIASETLLQASRRNLEAALTVVTSFEEQLKTYERVKEQIVASAEAAVEASRSKLEAEQQQLIEHEAALAQIQADYDRQKTLFEENIVSQLKYQEAERKLREAEAKVAKAKAYIKAAQSDLEGKQNDRIAKEQKAQIDIDYAKASLRKANADVAKAESEVAKAESEVRKIEKDLLDGETKLARQQNQEVRAPFDGFVTQITPNQASQILKEGDPICVIVPETSDRAVQIWLDGNDAPLVEPGRHVRLQFEGWPAVQFAGWPSVAVGTFGGEVVSVDATDNGMGMFRVLVRPDPSDNPWPKDRFLRQGVRANGWVILENVPLWYEIWRNMNGFPPVVSMEEPKEKQPKVPKLPKP